jgi:hypothetical protein
MRWLVNPLFWLAILSTCQLTRADSIDPQISVGDPSAGTPLNSPTFSFQADANGGGLFSFTNETGQVWQSLDFFATLPDTDTITCSSVVYGSCDYSKTAAGNGKAVFDVGFEQPIQSAGIVPGQTFSVNLNDPGCYTKGGSWGPFTRIDAVANLDIPEPASWVLTLAGLLISAVYVAYGRRSA